jgi:hypothetical protein
MKKGTPHLIGVFFHIVLYIFLSIFFSPQIRVHILDVERSHIQFGSSFKNSGKPIPSQGSIDTSGDEEGSHARLMPYFL